MNALLETISPNMEHSAITIVRWLPTQWTTHHITSQFTRDISRQSTIISCILPEGISDEETPELTGKFSELFQHHSWNREPRITSRAEIITVWIPPLFIESKQRYSPYTPLRENTMADGSANRGRSPVGGFARLSFQRASIPFQFRCAVKHPHDGLKTAA